MYAVIILRVAVAAAAATVWWEESLVSIQNFRTEKQGWPDDFTTITALIWRDQQDGKL